MEGAFSPAPDTQCFQVSQVETLSALFKKPRHQAVSMLRQMVHEGHSCCLVCKKHSDESVRDGCPGKWVRLVVVVLRSWPLFSLSFPLCGFFYPSWSFSLLLKTPCPTAVGSTRAVPSPWHCCWDTAVAQTEDISWESDLRQNAIRLKMEKKISRDGVNWKPAGWESCCACGNAAASRPFKWLVTH